MNKHTTDNQMALADDSQAKSHTDRREEFNALTAEIVELFYTQTYSPDSVHTASDVCKAFSDILLRHWELCCIVIYLRDDDGRLRESAIHTDEHLDELKARSIGMLLAAAVEQDGREVQMWINGEKESTDEDTALHRALQEADLSACFAMPIYARGELVGALATITRYPDRLRAALHGVRFIAAPIVIAVGNARRATAMREQHQRIQHLLEELQERTHALEDANRELQRVAHYRSLFLARMSHELRTPLTSILGFTEILLDQEKLTDTQHRFCEKIHSSGQQLQTSLDQLVDLSRLEAGQTELFVHEFSLREALRESCAAVMRLAQKQKVKIDCAPANDLPPIVSDEGKLRQVLYNFFAFAISRSPEDERITVRATNLSAPGDAAPRFQITIEDTGEPLEDMASIFEPIDLDAPSEHAMSMNELGLAIARRLIDALGGRVALESTAASGLKVSIELPCTPPEIKHT